MAAFVIGCGAYVYDKINTKRKEKRAKQAYDEFYEDQKVENKRRSERLSGSKKSVGRQQTPHIEDSPPPSYEAALQEDKKSLRSRRSDRSATSGSQGTQTELSDHGGVRSEQASTF